MISRGNFRSKQETQILSVLTQWAYSLNEGEGGAEDLGKPFGCFIYNNSVANQLMCLPVTLRASMQCNVNFTTLYFFAKKDNDKLILNH